MFLYTIIFPSFFQPQSLRIECGENCIKCNFTSIIDMDCFVIYLNTASVHSTAHYNQALNLHNPDLEHLLIFCKSTTRSPAMESFHAALQIARALCTVPPRIAAPEHAVLDFSTVGRSAHRVIRAQLAALLRDTQRHLDRSLSFSLSLFLFL